MSAKLLVLEWGGKELLVYSRNGAFVALAHEDGREQVAFYWPHAWEIMCIEEPNDVP